MPLLHAPLYGNYQVLGPAVICKVSSGQLVAHVQPGGALSVMAGSAARGDLGEGGAEHSTLVCSSSDSSLSSQDEEGGGAAASPLVVALAGVHLQLEGSYELDGACEDAHAAVAHDGKLIVSPARLSQHSCITLLPGGALSHPVNVRPHARPAQRQQRPRPV